MGLSHPPHFSQSSELEDLHLSQLDELEEDEHDEEEEEEDEHDEQLEDELEEDEHFLHFLQDLDEEDWMLEGLLTHPSPEHGFFEEDPEVPEHELVKIQALQHLAFQSFLPHGCLS